MGADDGVEEAGAGRVGGWQRARPERVGEAALDRGLKRFLAALVELASDGGLGGYEGGLEMKKRLLEMEKAKVGSQIRTNFY